jgi:hypothetical protein
MELLVIKSGENYIRVKTDHYRPCQLVKASVFPMDKLDVVKNHVKRIRAKGFRHISISRLTLSETPFESLDQED